MYLPYFYNLQEHQVIINVCCLNNCTLSDKKLKFLLTFYVDVSRGCSKPVSVVYIPALRFVMFH